MQVKRMFFALKENVRKMRLKSYSFVVYKVILAKKVLKNLKLYTLKI